MNQGKPVGIKSQAGRNGGVAGSEFGHKCNVTFLEAIFCASCMTVHIIRVEKCFSLFLLVKLKTELTVKPVIANLYPGT